MLSLLCLVDVNKAVNENDVAVEEKNPKLSINPAYIGWVWWSLFHGIIIYL